MLKFVDREHSYLHRALVKTKRVKLFDDPRVSGMGLERTLDAHLTALHATVRDMEKQRLCSPRHAGKVWDILLVHDLPEVRAGDQPGPEKYKYPISSWGQRTAELYSAAEIFRKGSNDFNNWLIFNDVSHYLRFGFFETYMTHKRLPSEFVLAKVMDLVDSALFFHKRISSRALFLSSVGQPMFGGDFINFPPSNWMRYSVESGRIFLTNYSKALEKRIVVGNFRKLPVEYLGLAMGEIVGMWSKFIGNGILDAKFEQDLILWQEQSPRSRLRVKVLPEQINKI